jgi:uncharacterized protein (DUF427 family)
MLVRMTAASSDRERVRVEQSQKRVRAYLAGELVADTTHPLLVWEGPSYPAYYLPLADVRAELIATGATERSPSRGPADVYDIKVGRSTAAGAARRHAASPIEELRDHVRIDWHAMDEWLEEDEPVYVHPRSPYVRVDVLSSSRHVQVVVDGVTVADSHQPRILFETGLPPRCYLPLTDVRMDLLTPTSTETQCPYKGTATYWSLEVDGKVHADAVWMYRAPLPESQKIAGLACFYNERVDLTVDGVLLDRPHTHFSPRLA